MDPEAFSPLFVRRAAYIVHEIASLVGPTGPVYSRRRQRMTVCFFAS